MKRFKYFFLLFSLFALLVSFSVVDVTAGVLGDFPNCVQGCQDSCDGGMTDCRGDCLETDPRERPDRCIAACAIIKEECLRLCIENCF